MKKNFGRTLLNNKSYLLVGLLAVVATVLVATNVLTRRTFITPDLLTKISYTMIMVVSLNLVVGFLGELSLGHAGFMYIGAYVAGLCMYYTENLIPGALLRFAIAMVMGGLAAMLFGFIVGLPALRLRGDYLAIVTLAFGEIIRGVLKNIAIGDLIKTPATGFIITDLAAPYAKYLFLIGFVLALLTLFCVQNIVNSKHGRAITAIKDNEIAARAMGVNITYYKLIVFAIAAFFAGIAGAVYSNLNPVSPDIFDYNYSIEFLVMVVLGGMGSVFGSLISSIIIVFLNVELNSILTGNLAGLKNLVYALILIIMMIVNSSPKLAPLREKMNWHYISSVLFKGKKAKKVESVSDGKEEGSHG